MRRNGAGPRRAGPGRRRPGARAARGRVTAAEPRVLVLNPSPLTGPIGRVWGRAAVEARARLANAGVVETRGDGGDADRLAEHLGRTHPAVVVAAGGDGTVHLVVEALMRLDAARRPALAILPLGTANNVARSLGLAAVRAGGTAALARALAAATDGRARPLDLGHAADRHLVGSLALGMDADILALRNRACARWGLGRGAGGYPLYLWSCAVNVLARRHGAPARLALDGAWETCRPYNILVTNTALYAGEFRFDTGDHSADGRLDCHVFADARDYVRRFVRAWRRQVAHERGGAITPAPELRRIREARVELAAPVAVQIDGEEVPPVEALTVRVLPGALTVRVPAAV